MMDINNIKKRVFKEFQEDLINEKEKIFEQFQEDLLTEKGLIIDNFKKHLTAETDQSFNNYKAVLNYIRDNKIKEFEDEAGKTDVGNKLTEICKKVENNDQKLLELCEKFDSILVDNRPNTRSKKRKTVK